MAYLNIFTPLNQIDEREVFELTRKTGRAFELQPSRFEGDVALWAESREKEFGERITPRFVHVEYLDGEPHHVAWIKREIQEADDEEPQCFHHLTCDCSLEAEKFGSPELVFGCRAIVSTMKKRAWLIGKTLKTEEVLDSVAELPPEALWGISPKAAQIEVGVKTMTTLLEHDVRHPEDWVGNAIQYRHELPILQIVLGYSAEDVRKCAEYFEKTGHAVLDDDSIRLEEDTISEILEDKENRERFQREFKDIADSFEEE